MRLLTQGGQQNSSSDRKMMGESEPSNIRVKIFMEKRTVSTKCLGNDGKSLTRFAEQQQDSMART